MTTAPSFRDIGRLIYLIRGSRVMLDSDLAHLYGTDTRALNRAVRRNLSRFPERFMFELTWAEYENLMCQIGTSSSASHGGRRKAPLVFTEHGVVMLSSVLNSARAIQVNIAVVEAFVRLRDLVGTHRELIQKINLLESKYDRQFRSVFDAIRELMSVRAHRSRSREQTERKRPHKSHARAFLNLA